MESTGTVLDHVLLFAPLLGTAAGVLLVLFGGYWALFRRHPELGQERELPRHMVMLGLTLAGAVAIAMALPVGDSTRNQVLALIGLLISAVVAFSSTTFVANLMAGIMLRLTRPFKIGDFVRVGEYAGRVAERGVLDTEIQTEQRELIALPNTYLISFPVAVVRSSGAIVSATLSLGYDIHHGRVEPLLIDAARSTPLEEPFVQIIELGNVAITYRVSGLLTEVKSLLTTRSNLHRAILDTLHDHGIEIVSPSFMNQRRVADGARCVPQPLVEVPPPTGETSSPEKIVFDKAEQAEQREQAKQRLRDEIQELERQAKAADSEQKAPLAEAINGLRSQLAELENPEREANGKSRDAAGPVFQGDAAARVAGSAAGSTTG